MLFIKPPVEHPYGVTASHLIDREIEEANRNQTIFSSLEHSFVPPRSPAETPNQADLWFLIGQVEKMTLSTFYGGYV